MMFNFCKHKWKIIDSSIGKATYCEGATKDVTVLLLQCKICGDIKESKVTGIFGIKGTPNDPTH